MRFSVWPASVHGFADLAAVVGHCERTGWDGAWVMDHFMGDRPDGAPDDTPVLEALTVLPALAARTERIRLGPLVLGGTYRHPAVVAKAAATLDELSGGRFVLGLGAGWQVNEHAAYGIDLLPVRERLDRFEESCAAIRSLLTEDRTTLVGDHVTLNDAPCRPTPPPGRVPILVGAKGERRGLRIAALHADEWNSWATVEQLRHRSDVLARHCADVGRDPGAIRRSTQAVVHLVDDPVEADRLRAEPSSRPRLVGTPAQLVDQVGAYAEAGLDELVVPDWTMGTGPGRLEVLDRIQAEVAPAFR
ncbi:LLM class flavin-dependent oxidoreductase [Iamia majanohamensis]|uniref:LLM class flavin-dependent oxidoreductase n=1 Tax=Iamia majanohamensis TaxID=467976 RepID=A0AAE9Y6R0_9ACTN|nr:LLM class flavin-dependent oxidoreductase [Iamia majanohamensis]WCO65279.1 LLM class flavin-dependent oxidoreductase [Iamia majanohamensis]